MAGIEDKEDTGRSTSVKLDSTILIISKDAAPAKEDRK